MKNNITEIVFILDRSGSMAGLESDTIGGFNAMLEKQRKVDGLCYVSTYLFDNINEVVHDRIPLGNVAPMDNNTYVVRGSTALLDAMGEAMDNISKIHKYIRPEDVPQNTIFVITTDGMENSSHKYTSAMVKEMIERKKKENGWEFVFLGANIDAVETAESFGISPECAVNYHADAKGTSCMYSAVADAVCSVRSEGYMAPSWRNEIDSDFKNRKKSR